MASTWRTEVRANSAWKNVQPTLPMAAVVLPAASSASVRSRMSSPIAAISAMPPALSQMGPYASIARPTWGTHSHWNGAQDNTTRHAI